MKRLTSIAFAFAVAATAAACSAPSSTPTVASTGSSTPSADPVAFARCMRSHGLPDFPDPNSNGNINASSGPGSGAMDQNSPQYASAYAACKSLVPPMHSKGGGLNRAQTLKYAQCMRAHGLADFPDPNSRGELVLSQGGDLDPSSPLFKKAQNACKKFQPGGAAGHASGGH